MTLVSHAHGFVYLKTGKTAGTSAEVALEPLCMPAGHVPSHTTDMLTSEQGIVGARGALATGTRPTWYNHMTAAEVRDLLGAAWDRYARVACIRNPFDKMLSAFFFFQRDARQAPKAEQIARFRDFAGRTCANPDQAAQRDYRICHIGDDLVLTDVLRFEHLAEDLARFAACIKAPAPQDIPRLKTQHRDDDSRSLAEWYDDATAAAVRRAFAWMFTLGGYALDPEDTTRTGGAI
ncbi:sulfotransferase family 2 domain-containing protein [Thalassovita aquimarina]|uniref:Sulfotransferase family 2 domain-containing protein n=1 Tax=Thalassovita aquimarina TaxID=2785917 RepID=A0ABS5HPN1_9RHOB|nr:sulfotransferase family 2 domain-containing protein [Thalassovita aquimarina]MBR9650919.1 sulfotransferase family 2 domain-containing protein [Thalassovita aquimarina]